MVVLPVFLSIITVDMNGSLISVSVNITVDMNGSVTSVSTKCYCRYMNGSVTSVSINNNCRHEW
jgi:hypothetical protein